MEQIFEVGDLVIHPQHGAGKITGMKRLTIGDEPQSYYNIDLVTEGYLMIPVKQVDDNGIRPVRNKKRFIDVLKSKPKTLADNYRKRQAAMAKKIKSGDPLEVAEALRDLSWRQHVDRLPGGDIRLLARAKEFLVSILSVKPEFTEDSASEHIDTILEEHLFQREVPA